MKDQQSYISVFVAYLTTPSSSYEHQPRHSNIILYKVVWYVYRDKEQPQNKKLDKTNQVSNFLAGSLSNRDNVRTIM